MSPKGWHEAWDEMVARWVRRPVLGSTGCTMPLPPDGALAGSVPLDAIDAGHVADLLAAAALAAALVGQPAAEAACADAAPDCDGLEDLHIALAVAAADLDEAIAGHNGILHR
jgi:hypothetical protein